LYFNKQILDEENGGGLEESVSLIINLEEMQTTTDLNINNTIPYETLQENT